MLPGLPVSFVAGQAIVRLRDSVCKSLLRGTFPNEALGEHLPGIRMVLAPSIALNSSLD